MSALLTICNGEDMTATAVSGFSSRIRLATLCGTAVFVLTPWAAQAGGKFVVPKDCTAYVTVQYSDCQVSTHYICEKDPKGDQWAVYAGQDGPVYMSRIDAETRWVESYDLTNGIGEKIGSEAQAASFTDLLKTGRDDYDFATKSSNGDQRRYAGYDKLTGTSVTIDGVTLDQTEFLLTTYAEDGSMINTRKGGQLISRDWRIFFPDQEDFETADGQKGTTIDRPMSFAKPGEAGFLAAAPLFGCNMSTAQITPMPVPPHS